MEESIRSKGWAKTIGGKTKGQLYRDRDLVRDYQGGDSSLTQKRKASSSCSLDLEEIIQVRQRLSQVGKRFAERGSKMSG